MLDDRQVKLLQREMWAGGDYHAFASAMLWDLGPLLVAACGIGPGQRVLDVAAGTGNVAIRAAEAGAEVIASDLTPENFALGRREAAAHGVELEWVQADAEALPFGDAEFDVVTSSMGVIFAPDHQRVADQLVRVCRPGGRIGLVTLVPTGAAVDLFDLVSRYASSPLLGKQSPRGDEDHVRELFGDGVAALTFERRTFAANPLADLGELRAHHPIFALLDRELAGDPERHAEVDHELDALAGRLQGEEQELLLSVARRR
jgi:SAM-dependent methyltransferase